VFVRDLRCFEKFKCAFFHVAWLPPYQGRNSRHAAMSVHLSALRQLLSRTLESASLMATAEGRGQLLMIVFGLDLN
jgi:hypothetical protein